MHTTILLTVLLGFVSTAIKAGETDDAFTDEQREAIRELFHLAMDPKSETSSHIEFKNSVFAIIDEYDVLNGQCHMTEYYDRLKGECTSCSECVDESCFYKCQGYYLEIQIIIITVVLGLFGIGLILVAAFTFIRRKEMKEHRKKVEKTLRHRDLEEVEKQEREKLTEGGSDEELMEPPEPQRRFKFDSTLSSSC